MCFPISHLDCLYMIDFMSFLGKDDIRTANYIFYDIYFPICEASTVTSQQSQKVMGSIPTCGGVGLSFVAHILTVSVSDALLSSTELSSRY